MPAGPAPATGCVGAQLEAGLGLLELQLELRRHRVDAAGREEDDEGLLARARSRQLKAPSRLVWTE